MELTHRYRVSCSAYSMHMFCFVHTLPSHVEVVLVNEEWHPRVVSEESLLLCHEIGLRAEERDQIIVNDNFKML